MLTFDHRDFTKSALSLAGGMLGVALLAGWRSGGDIPTMSLTLGLPVGVLAFWGIYSLRMKRMARELGFISGQPAPPSKASQGQRPAGFRPKLSLRKGQGLTLEAARRLPRFRNRPKVAPLAFEGQDSSAGRDQWYM